MIFRDSNLALLKILIKLIVSKKIRCEKSHDFVGYTHKRKAENRIYGIVRNSSEHLFFKLSEEKFDKLFKADNKSLTDYLISIGVQLIPSQYKHDILSRSEFENLGYGLEYSFYHGDVSKGNVLKYGSNIILIDNEYEGMYSELFQNLDYLINQFYGNSRIGVKYYQLNWWLAVIQIYKPVTKEELIAVFNQRLDNGCDTANKILSKEYDNL